MTTVLRTYPVENPEITLESIRTPKCSAVIQRGGAFVYCDHTIAMRREYRGTITIKCQGVGCRRGH